VTPDFTAAVLAGGKGKRLGMDKTSLSIGGVAVLERILAVLGAIFPRVILVGQEGGLGITAAAAGGVRAVPDVLPGRGPLGGIYTALEYSTTPYVFVMACDMPYPSPALIRRLLAEAPGWEAVVPRRGEYIEPLFAVYARETRGRMERRLREGRLKIHELTDELKVRYLEEEEIRPLDPGFRSFFNINTPQDLETASDV
jgi:molybdopterin-guanine dinucleotide biosynthesis protein A